MIHLLHLNPTNVKFFSQIFSQKGQFCIIGVHSFFSYPVAQEHIKERERELERIHRRSRELMLSPRLMDCSGGLSSRDSSVDRSQRSRYLHIYYNETKLEVNAFAFLGKVHTPLSDAFGTIRSG